MAATWRSSRLDESVHSSGNWERRTCPGGPAVRIARAFRPRGVRTGSPQAWVAALKGPRSPLAGFPRKTAAGVGLEGKARQRDHGAFTALWKGAQAADLPGIGDRVPELSGGRPGQQQDPGVPARWFWFKHRMWICQVGEVPWSCSRARMRTMAVNKAPRLFRMRSSGIASVRRSASMRSQCGYRRVRATNAARLASS